MMDQRHKEGKRCSDDIGTQKENNRRLAIPIHHPCSLLQHPDVLMRRHTQRRLKREVLMSPIEMLTFR